MLFLVYTDINIQKNNVETLRTRKNTYGKGKTIPVAGRGGP
jgi:hypothetical protein